MKKFLKGILIIFTIMMSYNLIMLLPLFGLLKFGLFIVSIPFALKLDNYIMDYIEKEESK